MPDLLRSDPAEAAGRHLAAGRTAEARAIYERLLREQPGHVRALCGLGAITLRGGEVARAFELIGHAVAVAPGDAMAVGNLGVVYLARKEPDQAEACFRRAIGLDPDQPEPHAGLAGVLMARGEMEAAIASQCRAVDLAPQSATQHYNLGNMMLAAGHRGAAEAAFRQALALDAGLVAALNNLALLLKQDGRVDEAEALLDEALLHDPLHPELTANHADLLLRRGRGAEALAAMRRAVGLAPMNAELRASLGAALLELGHLAEAGQELANAFRAAPSSGRISLLLARLLRRQGRHEAALAAAERAATLEGSGKPAAAAAGELLLLLGRHAEAWERLGVAAAPEPLAAPDLGPHAELTGHPIRLVSLDAAAALFAARFIPHLAGRGMVPTVVCPPALAPLMAAVPGIAGVEPAEALNLASLAADGRPSLLLDDLPRHLAATPGKPATSFPVFDVAVPAPRAAGPCRVGLWWEGAGPGATLLDAVAGCDGLVSLQSGVERAARLERLTALGIADAGAAIGDFRELAEAIRGVDLVIVPDGPVAHVAVGLGVETWVLVGRDGSWYWPDVAAASRWYPAARAFRQSADGSWAAALQAVRSGLAAARDGDAT